MSQNSRVSLTSYDRKLRYRALISDLSTLDLDTTNNNECMEKTENAVREAQSLLSEGGVEERVKHPGEGYLDSRVLRATSDLAVRCSETVRGNSNAYDRHELAACIRESPEMWDIMLPKEVPTFAYLFGTMTDVPTVNRTRVRRVVERQRAAELCEPDNVSNLEKTEEGSEMVSKVNRIITKLYRNRQAPISYFHAVLHPRSFAKTIENVYYVSFLVRDGMVTVDLDEDSGLPFITPVQAEQRESDQRNLKDDNQFIVSIDMHRWQELVEAFEINEPLIQIKK